MGKRGQLESARAQLTKKIGNKGGGKGPENIGK